MKLGISFTFPHSSPEEWAEKHLAAGLSAVVFPCGYDAPVAKIDGYKKAADAAGLLIAEVGTWSNPLSPNPETAKKAREYSLHQLELAEYVGARCCVNISGAIGEVWDGGYPENYAPETKEKIVEYVRWLLDTVKPQKTAYALEPMPNMLPDSPESYLELIELVDRPGFAVHLDLVNLLASPRIFCHNRELADRCFALLGKKIRSCHIKDAALRNELTVSIREVECGKGGVDLRYYMERADAENPELPMIIEHLSDEAAYRRAIAYIKALRA